MALDRQLEARHRRHLRCMPGHRQPYSARADLAARGLHADDALALAQESRHLAILDDVHAQRVGGSGIAPCDRVMPGGAAARLEKAAINRKAGILREIEMRDHALHLLARQQFGVDAVQPHGVAAPRIGVHLRVGVGEVQHAALREHHVEVEVLAQPLPQLHRMLVEVGVGRQQVVGAHDGGVAPGIAAADPTLLQHGDVAQAVQLGEIIGSGKPMTAAADDHHVVGRLRFGIAPSPLPSAMPAQRLAQEAESRIFAGHALEIAHSPPGRIALAKLMMTHRAAARCHNVPE
jgi:hypothetical protein